MPRKVVAGPPCAGKSTWARENAGPGVTILDLDVIAREMGSPVQWGHPKRIRQAANAEFRKRLSVLPEDAIVVRSCPGPHERAAFAQSLDADLVLLAPTKAECKRRADADGRPVGTDLAIDQWFAIEESQGGDA